MKRIYFVRHGETVGNKERFFQTFDTELTEKGHEGAKWVGERLGHLELDVLIASPMKRAQQTAEHIAEHTELSVETFHDFHEHLQAEEVRGKSHDDPEISHYTYGNNYYEYFARDEVVAPGFENFVAVLKRLQSCATFLKEYEAEHMVVVAHATYLRSLASFLMLQENPDKDTNILLANSLWNLSNAAITEFTYHDGQWRLFLWNDHAHFAE